MSHLLFHLVVYQYPKKINLNKIQHRHHHHITLVPVTGYYSSRLHFRFNYSLCIKLCNMYMHINYQVFFIKLVAKHHKKRHVFLM